MNTFTELGISKPVSLTLEQLGLTQPTEIQQKSIPLIFSGKDLLASAQTGSGKTAAYALPMIECLQDHDKNVRALIIVPTRELCLQVEEQFRKFGPSTDLRTVTVYGGTGYDSQSKALKRGVDVIVATPGRLLDHIERKTVSLAHVEMLVLDEADRLLDMGFMPQVRRIIRQLSNERQTLMFSATFDDQVKRIAREFLVEPETVSVNNKQVEPTLIDQQIFHVKDFAKDDLLVKLIREMETASVLVFAKTKRRTEWVTDRLRDASIDAEAIHGDISQSQREKVLQRYRDGKFPVLVATDVAGRGLDIPFISHVINYDLPEAPEDYVHRIGRTGRAGKTGIAMSFVGEGESYLVRDIEKIIGKQLDPKSSVPRIVRRLPGRRRVI